MAYIKAGGDIVAGGDITVIDGSQTVCKSFEQCTPNELLQALEHHKSLAADERSRINKKSFRFFAIAACFGVGLASWRLLVGDYNTAMYIIGMVGIIVPLLLAVQIQQRRTPFEQRQLNTIDYLKTLLRERT